MFEEFMGIPAHPLLVHAPVVFVPLLALMATAYALIGRVRPHIRWVLGLLAVATPISALLAKLSGDAFFARLDAAGRITEGFYPTIENHQSLGNLTLYSSVVLAALTLAMVYLLPPAAAAGRRAGLPVLVVRVLTVVAAAVSVYYVVRTGDTGAKAVWTGY